MSTENHILSNHTMYTYTVINCGEKQKGQRDDMLNIYTIFVGLDGQYLRPPVLATYTTGRENMTES